MAKIVGLLLVSSLFYIVPQGVFASEQDDAIEHYQKGDYANAARQFKELQSRDQRDPKTNAKHLYNLGVSEYQNGNYEAAREAFEQGASAAAAASDPALQSRSLYNLGNTEVARGDLEGASRAFQESLKLNPDDTQTRENLEWVEKQIERKREQQQNDKNGSDQKEKQDQKNDQSGDKSKSDGKDKEANNQNEQKQSDKDSEKKSESEKSDQNSAKKDDEKKDSLNGKQEAKDQNKNQENQNMKSSENSKATPAPKLDQVPQPSQDEKAAERVLRSVQDRPARFLYRKNRQENPNPREKDW